MTQEKCTHDPNTCQVSFCGWPHKCNEPSTLSKETIKRIEEEAKVFWTDSGRNGYKAGATAEAQRSMIELQERDKKIEKLEREFKIQFDITWELQLKEKQLTTERDAYKEALEKAIGVIKTWHNADDVWVIYFNRSPEMKPIREVLQKFNNNK